MDGQTQEEDFKKDAGPLLTGRMASYDQNFRNNSLLISTGQQFDKEWIFFNDLKILIHVCFGDQSKGNTCIYPTPPPQTESDTGSFFK